METRLLRPQLADGRGGQCCLLQCCNACKPDKNSRSIWFKSTKEHFYHLNPPAEQNEPDIIPGLFLTVQWELKPNHILPLGFLKCPNVKLSLFYRCCKLNFLFWGYVWACAQAFTFTSNTLNVWPFLGGGGNWCCWTVQPWNSNKYSRPTYGLLTLLNIDIESHFRPFTSYSEFQRQVGTKGKRVWVEREDLCQELQSQGK